MSLHGNMYEVDAQLVGRRCELVYDPFDLSRIEVRYERRPLGLAVAVRIGRHTHPRVAPEMPPPAQGTGIDYLGLLAVQRDANPGAGERIEFAAIGDPGDPGDDDDDDGGDVCAVRR